MEIMACIQAIPNKDINSMMVEPIATELKSLILSNPVPKKIAWRRILRINHPVAIIGNGQTCTNISKEEILLERLLLVKPNVFLNNSFPYIAKHWWQPFDQRNLCLSETLNLFGCSS